MTFSMTPAEAERSAPAFTAALPPPGGYILENEWQSFRTRRDRTLELTSAPHADEREGRYALAVKLIDIFGDDTTKLIEATV